MTATDWRTLATESAQQRFADAQARLDDGDHPDTDAGRAQAEADRRFTDWYDANVLSPAQYERERQDDEAEFAAYFAEPADGARVEFEANGGVLFAAYRQDDPEHVGGSWFVYGEVDRQSWRELICRFELHPDGITVLPDGGLPAASGEDVDLLVFDQLLADGCTALPAPLGPSEFVWDAS